MNPAPSPPRATTTASMRAANFAVMGAHLLDRLLLHRPAAR
jgi:hypothetical protein